MKTQVSPQYSSLNCLSKSLLFSLSLHVCVVVFIHEKENWQCFSRPLSRHFPPCYDHVLHVMYPERGTLLNVSRSGYILAKATRPRINQWHSLFS